MDLCREKNMLISKYDFGGRTKEGVKKNVVNFHKKAERDEFNLE